MITNRQQILAALAGRRKEIAARFGVKRLALFGSAARDELRDGSDVDVIVEFEGPATFRGYFDLKDYLEIPDMLRNGNWNYAVCTLYKQHRPGVNQAECLACHKPLDNASYVFTLKELAAAK